jgi:hypothetical protein
MILSLLLDDKCLTPALLGHVCIAATWVEDTPVPLLQIATLNIDSKIFLGLCDI